MKLRNLLAGAFVVGLGAAAGPAGAQPETAASVDFERLQAPAQTLEVAHVNSPPMCDIRPLPTFASASLQPGLVVSGLTPCWDPRYERAPLWG